MLEIASNLFLEIREYRFFSDIFFPVVFCVVRVCVQGL